MNRHTILFVDDEAGVLRAIKRLFRQSELNVLTATNAADGQKLLETHDVHVVFSDQRMPGVRGTDFLKKVREQYPNTVRCIMSGYAEMESVVAAINDGNVYRFIAKPWDDEELKSVVHQCLELAVEIARERESIDELARRASILEEERNRQAELLQLKEALLMSSRDVLDRLPVAIAALDTQSRVIYANKRFANEFGRLPGSGLGELAAEPWRHVAENVHSEQLVVEINNASYSAHVARIDIGGQPHTLIAALAAQL